MNVEDDAMGFHRPQHITANKRLQRYAMGAVGGAMWRIVLNRAKQPAAGALFNHCGSGFRRKIQRHQQMREGVTAIPQQHLAVALHRPFTVHHSRQRRLGVWHGKQNIRSARQVFGNKCRREFFTLAQVGVHIRPIWHGKFSNRRAHGRLLSGLRVGKV
ncbi:MAG: hypothetical protein EBR79_02870 [Proteobacteria bacterium]|nr:hypothetical protein [Pseudomonadota bacterium]